MSFLLKIVEGPNKGAEIALVDGVAVTLGKGDDCDIVLADRTMPDAPLKVEASADGVTADGEALEPFAVKTLGATSFAVGPADAPWGELKWPQTESKGVEAQKPESQKGGDAGPEAPRPQDPEASSPSSGKRGGCCGCLVALLLLLLALVGLAWFFRDEVKPHAESLWERACNCVQGAEDLQPRDAQPVSLKSIAEKYGLEFSDDSGLAKISGNLRTRRDRLAATAEAYQAQPGVALDLSDDESFHASAEDALFTLSEGALKVAAATNRVLTIIGSTPSPLSLKKMLKALNSDLPKLRNVDATGVVIGGIAAASGPEVPDTRRDGAASSFGSRPESKKKTAPSFPVCGILTKPYPYLVMRDGRRIMEGASIGDGVIVKIDADSVVISNSTGRFTWKP